MQPEMSAAQSVQVARGAQVCSGPLGQLTYSIDKGKASTSSQPALYSFMISADQRFELCTEFVKGMVTGWIPVTFVMNEHIQKALGMLGVNLNRTDVAGPLLHAICEEQTCWDQTCWDQAIVRGCVSGRHPCKGLSTRVQEARNHTRSIRLHRFHHCVCVTLTLHSHIATLHIAIAYCCYCWYSCCSTLLAGCQLTACAAHA